MLNRNNIIRRSVFAFALLVMALLPCRCHADERLFLDGNPRYPLIYAVIPHRHYLDLDSCTIISDDEDGFEVSAQYLDSKSLADANRHICRFRKNKESGWELQFRNERYDKEWRTFISPNDDIEEILDEKGSVGFGLPDYYMFKWVYQQLFSEPYEDDFDDETLRRSVIHEEKTERHRYLWDDENYPCIWARQGWAEHLDKSSVYIVMESPPQCILVALVLRAPMFHNNDIMAGGVHSYKFLYDEEEEKMYEWRERAQEWMYLPPVGGGTIERSLRSVGEAVFYLAYGERFYGASPKWDAKIKQSVDVFGDVFYERLDGVDFEQ